MNKIDNFSVKKINKFEKEILRKEEKEWKKRKSYISMDEENESNKESEHESE